VGGKFAPLMILTAASLALATRAHVALADGGAVRYSGRCGERQVTVFTSPTPLRAGFVDVSVLVQDASSGKALPDVPVAVRAYSIEREDDQIHVPATNAAATNKLLRAAQLKVSAGKWHVQVAVEGCACEPPMGFDVDVAEALPPWVETSVWIGWPAAAIALFGVHQYLARRRPHVVN